MLDNDELSKPEEFNCPLTQDIMKQPKMTRTGHSFERDAILEWIRLHSTCPLTRKPLALHDLIPNRALEVKVQTWKSKHNECQQQTDTEETSTYDEDDEDDLHLGPIFMVLSQKDLDVHMARYRERIQSSQGSLQGPN